MKKIVLPLMAALSMTANANDMSVGGALGFWDYSDDTDSYSSYSLEAIFNYEMMDYLDASARVGVGIGYDTNDDANSAYTQSAYVTSNIEVYLKPKYTLQNLELYALLGYANIELESELENIMTNTTTTTTASTSGFAYGVGLSYQAFENNSVFVEWRQLPDEDDYELTAINLGLTIPL